MSSTTHTGRGIRRTSALVASFLVPLLLISPTPAVATDGPHLVRDLRPDGPSNPAALTAVGQLVFFTADDGVSGRELYVSDGTSGGTKLVKDIRPGARSSVPSELTAVGGRLFFVGNDGQRGPGLYVTDGTAAGTRRLRNRRPCDSESRSIIAHAGRAYLAAYNRQTGTCNLIASDGTRKGTKVAVRGIPGFYLPVSFQGRIYFVDTAAPQGTAHRQLWRTNNAVTGVNLVKQVSSGWIQELTVAGERLYFAAADVAGDSALWKSDGTTAGTKKVLTGASAPVNPRGLTTLSGKLLFTAFRRVGDALVDRGLWKSDGTGAGTKLVKELLFFDGARLTPAGTRVFFTVFDEVSGSALWRSNGTATGTRLVKRVPADDWSMVAIGSDVYMRGPEAALWRSDGTAAGTYEIPGVENVSNLVAAGASLFFSGRDPAWLHAGELYRYMP